MNHVSIRRPVAAGSAAALAAALLFVCAPAAAQEAPPTPSPALAAVDALAPRSSGEGAPIRQLHTVTLCTADIGAVTAFYGKGLGMRVRGPLQLEPRTRAAERRLWGIPGSVDWQLYLLDRPSVPGTIQLRVLVVDESLPRVHGSWDPREPGPFSIGFPGEDAESWDAELRAAGHESLMPLSRYQIPRADSTPYGIHETIFNAPDFVHAVIISRRDGMPQLGPTDAASGRGGPVYSAHIVDNSDRVLAFYVDTLGLELRSDRQFRSSGSKGALGVPDGTEFRFAIVYAPGASFGHLLFLDFEGRLGLPATGVPPRPPNRGLVMWSFPVSDLAATAARLAAAGVAPVAGPVELVSPSLGRHRALTVLDPNGFLVELFEPIPADGD
jgi:catechol 2,3-dioxygenase-like lactoylglutathione lyase family enzyme